MFSPFTLKYVHAMGWLWDFLFLFKFILQGKTFYVLSGNSKFRKDRTSNASVFLRIWAINSK